jgi:hypothetical protein
VVARPDCFGPVAEHHGRVGVVEENCSLHGSQEIKRETGRGQ